MARRALPGGQSGEDAQTSLCDAGLERPVWQAEMLGRLHRARQGTHIDAVVRVGQGADRAQRRDGALMQGVVIRIEPMRQVGDRGAMPQAMQDHGPALAGPPPLHKREREVLTSPPKSEFV